VIARCNAGLRPKASADDQGTQDEDGHLLRRPRS
jgi:hypothetical protein